jgi:steroid delta-isomerase-like uncharacterized protein
MTAPLQRLAEVGRYFDSWNAHDSASLLAAFAQGGTYTDPTVTSSPLSESALEEHARALFSAFPDLNLHVVSAQASDGDLNGHSVVARWLMRGTHAGRLCGLPPLGGSLVLPGVDLITVESGKILAVERHFDRQTMAEQLGFQVIVQPGSDGIWQLGYAWRATAGSTAEPGAISLTWTDVRSREEAEQLEAIGGLFGAELTAAPGFISVVTGGIGSRLFTIAAWESEEAIRSALRNRLHTDGIKRFHTEDFLGSFGSGIYTAHRLGPVWVRCTSCARVMEQGQTDGNCTCGKPLIGPPQRW